MGICNRGTELGDSPPTPPPYNDNKNIWGNFEVKSDSFAPVVPGGS